MIGFKVLARGAWMAALGFMVTACGPELAEAPAAPEAQEVLETSQGALTQSGQISSPGARYTHSYSTVGGKCRFQTTAGTLTDTYLSLYGPSSTTTLIAEDNDSGVGAASYIQAYLHPGTYYATVRGNTSTQTGTYQIAMDCYPAVRYRLHTEDYGWEKWVLDGVISGTRGLELRAEAMELYLLSMPGVSIHYTVHLGGVGWTGEYANGATAGTTGQSRQMEAVRIWLSGAPAGCQVNYSAHVEGIGWQGTRSGGAIAGTTGGGRRLEALKVWLSGC
ncbi:MAG: Ig domain-containing protein [Myxococcaceae bacterium]|nr:MAG: Ig domain-containing protein [Myxococcaceae bacterium]